MALVAEEISRHDLDVLEAEVVGARIVDPKIVDGKIVGGRIVGGRIIDTKFSHLARRARHIDTEHFHSEIVAATGLGLALLMWHLL